jgi:hypothetical protein
MPSESVANAMQKINGWGSNFDELVMHTSKGLKNKDSMKVKVYGNH